ncbi:MAG: AzlC family ABC transporter permease [Telluria sp.]
MTSPRDTPSAVEIHDPAAWREGFRDGFPLLLGIGAWAVVVGVTMVKSGLTAWQASGMTLLVYAGSAQLASLPLIAAHAPIWVIFLTGLVVNLRFVIFSALLAPHFAHLPWRRRLLLSFISGDGTIALYLQRFPVANAEAGTLSYLKGLLYPNWVLWQVCCIAGVLLGRVIPASWGLDFAGTVAILCMTVPLVTNHAALAGVAVAGAVAVLARPLPYKLGLLLAVVGGMVVAMIVQETGEKRRARRV